MKWTLSSLILSLICLASSSHAADLQSSTVLLRATPNNSAPIIAEVIASRKVILDAAPATQNAAQGWRQLPLPSPFNGHVPTSAVGKNFAISEGTAVHYLPTTDSATITIIEAGDLYQVASSNDSWTMIRLKKPVVGYFLGEAAPMPAFDFDAVAIPQVEVERVREPLTIPAARAQFNPDDEIGTTNPNALPPENVVWHPVGQTRSTHTQANAQFAPDLYTQAPAFESPTIRVEEPTTQAQSDFMVSRHNTQAREYIVPEQVTKAPRMLAGKLVREIKAFGPYYPIRLRTPEGRLIAYVDFSKLYIDDITPYINKKVYVEGQIHPAPQMSSQLVIYAESLRITE